jgi:hypothetical protein
MRTVAPSIGRRLAAIEEKLTPSKSRTVFVWKDVIGEDKSEQTIAEMKADGRLTDQDRIIVVSWRQPEQDFADGRPRMEGG